jgi:hypothetical protein
VTPPRVSTHPEHASEQAYLEKIQQAESSARQRLERSAELAPDKASARAMKQKALARLKDPVDLDALCFGRIDLDAGHRLYLGRGQSAMRSQP